MRSTPFVRIKLVGPGAKVKAPPTPAVIVWRGPSIFTGNPVQVLLSCLNPSSPSRNWKTGPMIQATILPVGVNPTRGFGTLAERDTCGACRLTGAGAARVCYAAMHAWLTGRSAEGAPVVDLAEAVRLLGNRPLRIGAYGDPAAVPTEVWRGLVDGASHWTGFTHAWRTCDQALAQWVMASVDGPAEQREAAALGWRTFRIRHPGGELALGEVPCANESSGVQCIKCALCKGNASGAANVVITVHGLGSRRFVETA